MPKGTIKESKEKKRKKMNYAKLNVIDITHGRSN